MAAPPQAPSPEESETRDHCQSVPSVVESHCPVHLQLRKCKPQSLPAELWALRVLELLDLPSSETTSQISHSAVPARTHRDEEFTGPVVGSIPRMEPEHFVKGSPLSTWRDVHVYSLGFVIFAFLTNYYSLLNETARRYPHNTRSLTRSEVYTDDASVTDRQTREKHGGYAPKNNGTRPVLKLKSCKDGFVAKGNNAHHANGSVIDSSCEANLSLNASTEIPIQHRREGGLVYSGGPSHPAAAEESSTTPHWHVASSAANHMTGDVSQLTDRTPAPANLAVQVPNMGSRRVHSIGSLRTATMSLQNVYYVPGLDKNLVSSSQLAKLGYTITLGPSECRIIKNDQGQTLVGKAHFTDDYLFELDFLRVPPSTN